MLIAFVLFVMVGNTVRTLQGVGWLPITPIDIELPLWMGTWLGVYPTVETLAAQFAALVFVVGSYFLAELVRKRPSGRAVPPAARPASANGVSPNGAPVANGASGDAAEQAEPAEQDAPARV